MRTVRRSVKPLSVPLALVCLVMLTGTPAYAQQRRVERQRVERLRGAAERMGLDEDWVRDPRAYRDRVVEARKATGLAQVDSLRQAALERRAPLVEDVTRLRRAAALQELDVVVAESARLLDDDGATAKERARGLSRRLAHLLPAAEHGLVARAEVARARSDAEGNAAERARRGVLEGATRLGAQLEAVIEEGVDGRARTRLSDLTEPTRERATRRSRGAMEPSGIRGPRAPVVEPRAPAQSREEYLQHAMLLREDDGLRLADAWDEPLPFELEGIFADVAPEALAGYRAALPLSLANSSWTSLAELARSAIASQLPAPVAADSAETVDAPFAPEVQAQADALENDPARMYTWVRNHVDFELYHGSAKGAVGALFERRANDFDQASLLIAMLRASGFPARYVYGTVEIPAGPLLELTGTTTASMAANVLLSTGTPASVVQYADGRQTLELEHVWVTAYLPYGDYRGAGRLRGEPIWVELDPSFKGHEIDEGVNLAGAVSFDFSAWLASNDARLPVDSWRDALRGHVLSSGLLCPTIADAQYTRSIVPVAAGKLSDTLPYAVVARLDNYAEVPGAKRHSVTLTIPDAFYGADVTTTLPLARAYGKKLALRWEGSTAAEQTSIDTQGVFGVASSLRVRPSFWLDDERLAAGGVWNRGEDFRLDVALSYPGFGAQTATHQFNAGAYHVVQVSPGRPSASLLARADALRGRLEAEGAPAWRIDEAGLWRVGLSYHQQVWQTAQDVYGVNRMGFFADPLEALVTRVATPTGSFGFTTGIKDGGWNLDAAKNTVTPYGRDGGEAGKEAAVRLWGWTTSALEHRVWEAYGGADGISAVRALQIAKASGQPIYTVRSAFEWQAVRSALTLSSFVKSQIQQYVAAGYEATFHRDPVVVNGWSGAGYVLFHPETLEGRYLIDGTNGGGLPISANLVNTDEGGGPCATPPDPPWGSNVNPANGLFYFDEVDLSTASLAGTVSFRRSYGSDARVHSRLGPGFTHTFEQHLDLSELDDDLIRFVDDTGEVRTFAKLNDGTFLGPPGSFELILPGASGYSLVFADDSRLVFDASGALYSSARGQGRWSPLYVVRDSGGRPLRVDDDDGGLVFSFTHDEQGRLLSVADASARVVTYGYDAGGHLVSVTGLDGASWAFTWIDGRLASKTSPTGDLTRYFYDAEGRAVRAELPDGGQRTLAYDPLNRRTVFTDDTGASTIYEYDDKGVVTRIVDPAGNSTELGFDEQYCASSRTDALGNTSSETVDDSGKVIQQTRADGATLNIERNAGGQVLSQTDETGRQLQYAYDADGDVESLVIASGETIHFAWDELGRPSELIEGDGSPRRLEYDQWGNATRATAPTGEVYEVIYDAAGRPLRYLGAGSIIDVSSDERGHVTRMDAATGAVDFEWDGLGRLIRESGAGGQSTEYEWDFNNQLVWFKDSSGAELTATYDSQGRRLSATDTFGNTVRYEYASAGGLARMVDREGAEIAVGYCADEAEGSPVQGPLTLPGSEGIERGCVIVDGDGDLIEQTFDSNGNVISFSAAGVGPILLDRDTAGRITRTVDELGRVTTLAYNDGGELTRVVDALGGVTTYQYDGFGNMLSLTDPSGRSRHYQYDAQNRVTETTFEDGTRRLVRYNAAGQSSAFGPSEAKLNQVRYRNPVQVSGVDYWDEGADDVFEFDADNRLVRRVSRDAAEIVRYDAVGRGAGTAFEDVDAGFTVSYDEGSRLSSVVLDGESAALRYYYDKNDRPIRIVAPDGSTFTIRYSAGGLIEEVGFPNGLTQHFLYGPRSEVLSVLTTNGVGDLVAGFSYTYDAAGNRTRSVDHLGRSVAYRYDELNRLVEALGPGSRAESYSYDAAGNRLSATLNGQLTSYQYDEGGRLVQTNGPDGIVSYLYDDEGRLASKTTTLGQTTYQYDARNHLVLVVPPAGAPVRYGYSAGGERVWREQGGEREWTLWSHGERIADVDDTGAVLRRYINGPADGLLFGVLDEGNWRYAHGDALRSVTHWTDDSGAVVSSFHYAPFGAAERTAGAVGGAPPMFTGVHWDEAAGIYLMRARAYDPFVGRFLSKDPVQGDAYRPKTLNPYAYGLNNPTLWTDRDGSFNLVDTLFTLLEVWTEADPVKRADKAIDASKKAVSDIAKNYVENFIKGMGMYGALALFIIELLWKVTVFVAFVIGLVFYQHYTEFFFFAAAVLEDPDFLKEWAAYTFLFFWTFITLFSKGVLDMIFEPITMPSIPNELKNGRWECARGFMLCYVANIIIAKVFGKLEGGDESVHDLKQRNKFIRRAFVMLLKPWITWLSLALLGCPEMGGKGQPGG